MERIAVWPVPNSVPTIIDISRAGATYFGHMLPSLDSSGWKRNRVAGDGWLAVVHRPPRGGMLDMDRPLFPRRTGVNRSCFIVLNWRT